jgi:hypothetical protein
MCTINFLFRMFWNKGMFYQSYFRIDHQKDGRKSGRIWIQWNASPPGLCWQNCAKLTTHLHLVSTSRMRGAIPPFPQYAFMAWGLVKHRANFTFNFKLKEAETSGSCNTLGTLQLHKIAWNRIWRTCEVRLEDFLSFICRESFKSYID